MIECSRINRSYISLQEVKRDNYLTVKIQYIQVVASKYRTPADLLIDRMGWGSPVVQRADSSPVYGGRASVIMDNPQSNVQSPEVEEIRQMPEMSLIATTNTTPTMNSTAVESFNPSNIVE